MPLARAARDGVDAKMSASFERQAAVVADNEWLYVYSVSFFLSFVATTLAVYHMRRLGGDIFRSTVRFVTTSFLLCTSLNALFGGLFYSFLLATIDGRIDLIQERIRQHGKPLNGSGNADIDVYYNGYALHGSDGSDLVDDGMEPLLRPDDKPDGGEAAFLTKLTHGKKALSHSLTLLLVLQNIFFVLSAYWILLLTHELYRLAKTTHDRGSKQERLVIRKYACGALFILVTFCVAGVWIVVSHSGYNRAFKTLSILEFAFIIFSVVYAMMALLLLRVKGRKNEHIHGMLVASPLYRRLKLMMVVCAIFTLPYSVLQLTLLGLNENAVDEVPDYLVGLLTTVYYMFGAAQAIVMGGSQQCCFRLLYPILPTQVREAPQFQSLRSTRRHASTMLDEATTPPERPVFVNTDIESSSALWAQAPQHVIDAAQRIHDDLMRNTLPKYNGYEITTAGDAFQLAFHNIEDAVKYCLEVQLQLLQAKWPSQLEGLVPSTKTERDFGLRCQVIFRGLRVRMGIHDTSEEEGMLVSQVHPVTGKTVYIGASEMIGREISDLGYGGQIVVSKRVAAWIRANEDRLREQAPLTMDYYGTQAIHSLELDVELYEVTSKLLDGRRKYFKRRRIADAGGVDDRKPESPVGSFVQSGDSTTEESVADFHVQVSPKNQMRLYASHPSLWTAPV
ncbi:hypothetical protein P43SY_005957 [Pythium insidiosum]|uniref:Guanylate cyclase domain-containing protein n=1 Tax=Pythium insidiosum TaxID=114742 RepID=A0AAD5LH32_PYTIN|nr:hypothetical protein P43SY_005957 [Pythium insidiosum]